MTVLRRFLVPPLLVALAAASATTASTTTATAAPSAPSAPSGTRPAPPVAGAPFRHVTWNSATDWTSGTLRGLQRKGGRLVVADSARVRRLQGRPHRVGTWTSRWQRTTLTELTPSWQAYTGSAWLEVQVRTRSTGGRTGSWDTVAVWSVAGSGDRRTLEGRGDDVGGVSGGSWSVHPDQRPQTAWQVRVRMSDRTRDSAISNLYRLDAVTTSAPYAPVPTSAPGRAAGRPLAEDVPSYSVAGTRGGPRWATAAAFTMAMEGQGSSTSRNHGPVAYAAGRSHDHGTGASDTFSFATAFLSTDGLTSSWVTRLADGAALEEHLADGRLVVVPLRAGARPVLVVGVEADGDVVVHDPSAPSDAAVRQVIDRADFESDWLSSGGLAGVVSGHITR